MKSSQLRAVSPIFVAPRNRLSKGVAALFAAALAMGLGAGSALAQGPYYPQVAPLGGSPFIPNGFPVLSNAELNLIESNMPAGKTLIIPPVAPKVTATLADYKTAVQATATYVANGLGGSVTLATLAAEVAKYRQGPPSQVADGLGSVAAGIIASGSGTKVTDLQALASGAAGADPASVVAGGALFLVLDKASKNGFEASVGAITNSAITGAASGTPPPAALTSTGIRSLVGNAVSAITGNPGLTPAVKTTLVSGLPATIMVNALVAGSPANIDQASAALFANAASVTPGTMAGLIAATVPVLDVNYGAIAQGGLRSNPAAAATIGTALSTFSLYAQEITSSFTTYGAAFVAGSAAAQTGTYSAAAIAAAGATKFGSSTPQIVKELLVATGAAGVAAQDIINRGVAGAIGSPAQNVATAAVGAGGASFADVTIGATTGAPIGSAGAIAKAVAIAGGLATLNIGTDVGNAAIAAAAFISPANKADAYSDIAFNLAATGGNATFQKNAIQAEVNAIATANGGAATAPTYIAVVAAAAGSPANRAAILLNGTTAPGAVVGDDDAASAAGVNLLAVLTNVPLSNYQATLAAVTPGSSLTIDASNLAVLYAASLGNPGDAAGSLAALIAKSGTSPTALTAAAISASRSKQTGLTIAASVAAYAKANPTGDIQASIGHQILDNPTYVKEIAAAATVVLPQYSHNIAHTVAFNQPKTASDAVAGIFLHSRITNTVGVAGTDKLTIGDRPAAGAAITAALATGILESTQLTAVERKTALQGAIVESVKALVNPLYNDATAGPAAFRASDGVTAASFTLVKAKGVAGGITGFVAQLVKPADTAAVVNPSSDIYNALFQASYNAGVLTGTTYQLDIAQAAAQAFAWITGIAVSPAAVTDIANAVYTGYPVGGAAQLTKIQNAVAFGLTEGAGHVNAGAGAGGLRDGADPFYTHSSAQGKPVSNIFAL